MHIKNTDVNFIVTFHAVILKNNNNKINISNVVNIPESVYLQHPTLTKSDRCIFIYNYFKPSDSQG